MKNILVVGAHYDDAELGCGGTALKMTNLGCKVYKITLTDNEFSDGSVSIKRDTCKESSKKACELLNMIEIDFPQVKYGELAYNSKIMHELENVILEKKIDTIFMHHHSDMHHDHEEAFKICQTAGRHCDNILTYQSNGYILTDFFSPNYFVDISCYIEQKKKALSIYEQDQSAQNNQGRLFQVCIDRNGIWGYGNHVKYAEGFHVIKMVNS